MTNTQTCFNYDVKISPVADLLKSGPLLDALKKPGEMMIASKQFETFEECEDSLKRLMTAISMVESKLSNKKKIVVNKVNPALEKFSKRRDDTSWDSHTMVRYYVADAEALKQSVLAFEVFGQIRSNHILGCAD